MTRAFRRCERLYVFAKRPALNSSRARFARITYSLPVYCRRKPTPAEAPLPISRCSRIGRHGYAPASRLWRRARKTANNSKLKGSSQAESPGTAGACCTHNSTRRDSTNAHIDAAYLASIKELLWLSTDCKSSGAVQLGVAHARGHSGLPRASARHAVGASAFEDFQGGRRVGEPVQLTTCSVHLRTLTSGALSKMAR